MVKELLFDVTIRNTKATDKTKVDPIVQTNKRLV